MPARTVKASARVQCPELRGIRQRFSRPGERLISKRLSDPLPKPARPSAHPGASPAEMLAQALELMQVGIRLEQ